MKKHLAIIVLSIFIFVIKAKSQEKEEGIDFQVLDRYIQKSMTQWEIPGMAVAIVQGDSIAFAKGYGLREYGKSEKVDDKTLFAVASNSKSFTSAAISILVDEGKLKWDDKVIKYLPYFQLYNPYVTNEMTIRDLLCHRSGLKTFSGDLLWYESKYTTKEVIERARFLKPKYGFRTNFGYSNIMFAVAGEIIKEVTGQDWRQYITNNFFYKLDMTESLTSVSQLSGKTNIASPHHTEKGNPPLPIPYMKWDNIAPAAAIISNIDNMSKWLIMQMNEGKYKGNKILSADQVWEMHKAHTPNISSKNWSKYFPKKSFTSYGLGWEVFNYNGYKVVNHGGGADGMISKTMFIPEKKIGIVVLTNSVNYLSTSLMYYILDDYFGEPKDWSSFYKKIYDFGKQQEKSEKKKEDKNRIQNTKPTLDLEAYTGTYGGELYGDAEVTIKSGKLILKLLPTPKFVGELEHWQYNTFTIKFKASPTLPSGKVNFTINAKGKVEKMEIDIPNPDFDFKELELKKE